MQDFRDPQMWHFLEPYKIASLDSISSVCVLGFLQIYEMFYLYLKHLDSFLSELFQVLTEGAKFHFWFLFTTTFMLFSAYGIEKCMHILFLMPLP